MAGALFLLLQNAVLTWVEQKTSSALAALVVAATPFWMILLNRLLVRGTRLTLPLLAGLVLGFAGVAVIVLGRNRDGTTLVDPLHAGAALRGIALLGLRDDLFAPRPDAAKHAARHCHADEVAGRGR